MSGNTKKGLDAPSDATEIIGIDALEKIWKKAFESDDRDDFDNYYEGLLQFHANILFLQNNGKNLAGAIALLDGRIEPITEMIGNSPLNAQVFIENLLTPSDISKIFPDIDEILGGFRDAILGILSKEVPTSPPFEAIIARAERGDKPLH